MRDRTIQYFDMVKYFIQHNNNIQLIVSDYGSDDGIRDFIVNNYKMFDYVYTEPNDGQFFNISKCNNNTFRYLRNEIIFTNSIDWRYDYELLEYIDQHFKTLGDMVFEVPILVLDENNHYKRYIHLPVFLKKHIMMVGGWDERIFNWGQDDRDVMQSIFFLLDVVIYRVTDKKNQIFHLWHEPKLYNEHGAKKQNIKNLEFLNDNIRQRRKNAINSYWNVKINVETNPSVKTD